LPPGELQNDSISAVQYSRKVALLLGS